MWRSLVARPLWERKAAGSNPATPILCVRIKGAGQPGSDRSLGPGKGWYKKKAGDRARTGDIQLVRLALYQLSYTRLHRVLYHKTNVWQPFGRVIVVCIPITPYAPVAQGIEQLPSKQWVRRSNRRGGAFANSRSDLTHPGVSGFSFR